ncbi:hypothetical protein NDU88_006722 [Pleurodeles waltl]|uniref:Uncharacterized protein n=1 Tax=Pleurodeles waltl TaxID=8319 RepID=A0AAV7TZ68_PLEWA|nr:hypothetical protein NDU88_006722 [Pleurodeles waltl]
MFIGQSSNNTKIPGISIPLVGPWSLFAHWIVMRVRVVKCLLLEAASFSGHSPPHFPLLSRFVGPTPSETRQSSLAPLWRGLMGPRAGRGERAPIFPRASSDLQGAPIATHRSPRLRGSTTKSIRLQPAPLCRAAASAPPHLGLSSPRLHHFIRGVVGTRVGRVRGPLYLGVSPPASGKGSIASRHSPRSGGSTVRSMPTHVRRTPGSSSVFQSGPLRAQSAPHCARGSPLLRSSLPVPERE